MLEEDLLKNGFREWPVNRHLDRHDRQWGISPRQDGRKQFMLLVRLWGHSKYGHPDGWDAVLHVRKDGFMRLERFVGEETAGELLAWAEASWHALNCENIDD